MIRAARNLYSVLLAFACILAATHGAELRDPEAELFRNASQAFQDKFYDRAEQQFSDFLVKHPASTNVSHAILLAAEARYFQRKFDPALQLLSTNLPRAGSFADEYVFWQGQAYSGKSDFTNAVEKFAQVLKDFPQSPLKLAASYLQAYCFFQLKDQARTIELLQNPEGAFQTAARSALANEYTARGRLLLAEALFGSGKSAEARAAAASAEVPVGNADLAWERSDLLARIELASPNPEAALPHLSNAVAAARAARKPILQAQSWNLEAEVFRKLNQPARAVNSYEQIAAGAEFPVDQRRLAVLKSAEILSNAGDLTNAIARVEKYLAANTNETALLRVKAGELWLDQFRGLTKGGKPLPADLLLGTNALTQARAHFNTVLTLFTNSTQRGRSWLDLGWTYWEDGIAFVQPARIQESIIPFRTAAETLTRSDDQALAIFKLADAQLFLHQSKEAATNYLAVLRNYSDLPQAKNALFEKAYGSLVRACIEARDFESARTFTTEFRQAFPNSPGAEETLFLFGQALARDSRTGEARLTFEEFIKSYPASPLVPEVRLAAAKALGAAGDWQEALKMHEQWLSAYTNHTLRAEVEFQRATLLDRAGNHTNALSLFGDFVVRFPTNKLAPAAQNWVADFYYDQEQWLVAEQNYQKVFQNTNWIGDPLTYRAQMMAAKTAFRRQGYNDARSYLTNLINNPTCPADLVPEAWFELGDVCLAEPIIASTNALFNFLEAARVFDRIEKQYPSNKLAVLALGKKGDCLFQIASYPNYSQSYAEATNAYLAVLNSKIPGVPVSARNQAEVGMGLVFKAMADEKPTGERTALLRAARDRFLNVVYGTNLNGERADSFYLKKAGLEAGRISEALGENDAALKLYRRLANEAPSMKSFWETRINSLQQQLAAHAGVQ